MKEKPVADRPVGHCAIVTPCDKLNAVAELLTTVGSDDSLETRLRKTDDVNIGHLLERTPA